MFIAHAEVKTGKRTQTIRSDGGGEYDSKVVTAYLQERGISQELTTLDTPQHNGVSERMNRTLLNMACSMLEDAKLPESFWFEAVKYAAYIHNATPTRALEDTMPEEVWSGNKPDVSCLRVFGARAFVHIPKKKCTKLSARSMVCTFVGFAENRLAYRLYHRQSHRFLDSRDVIFDEGGPTPTLEWVVLEPDSVDGSDTSENEETTTQPLNDPPPSVERPKRDTRAPI